MHIALLDIALLLYTNSSTSILTDHEEALQGPRLDVDRSLCD